jgi:hypothetical protein
VKPFSSDNLPSWFIVTMLIFVAIQTGLIAMFGAVPVFASTFTSLITVVVLGHFDRKAWKSLEAHPKAENRPPV